MILVYDLRLDQRGRDQIFSGMDEQWQAYLRGEKPAFTVEGRIEELFFAPYEGEHRFKLDEGETQSTWIRQGEESFYVVRRWAKVEQVIFKVPDPIRDMPVVTRIWIGDSK